MTTCIHCHIKILSPVHLGCDEVYDPLSFSVDTANNRLVVFDTAQFLSQLDTDKLANFSAICWKGTLSSILEIYNFFAREKPKGRDLAVTSGFVRHYQKTLKLPQHDHRKLQQELNRFTIYRTAFLPATDRAYIPGSAVKGSLRTAYLNLLARTMKPEHLPKGNAKELEKSLLGGSFQSDPLRLVKVSDFMPVGAPKTKILYAVNEKKRIS
ncbi:MAG: type III-A CRISPR-associated RAMP protein Csm5, partial [Desulfomonilaceae bacterium]